MYLFSKSTISILLIAAVSLVATVEEENYDKELPQKSKNALNTIDSEQGVVGDFSIGTNEGKSRVKRQFGYDPYYYPRRYPYPPIIIGGIGLGGFGGYGFGRGFGRPGFGGRGFGAPGFGGFGGRGFGGRGFGGRGFGGRGFGGRGIGGRGGFGGFGGRGGRG